jgi:hypothetical protein
MADRRKYWDGTVVARLTSRQASFDGPASKRRLSSQGRCSQAEAGSENQVSGFCTKNLYEVEQKLRYLVFSLAELFLCELKSARRKRRDLRSKVAAGPGWLAGLRPAIDVAWITTGRGDSREVLPKALEIHPESTVAER